MQMVVEVTEGQRDLWQLVEVHPEQSKKHEELRESMRVRAVSS